MGTDLSDVLVLLATGAVGAALFNGLHGAWRDKQAARRAWLGEALAAFYAPVHVRLELMYQLNVAISQEHEERRREGEVITRGEIESKVDNLLVRSNIATLTEVRDLLQEKLY